MEKKRVVITGFGVVSPSAIGKGEFWDSLKKGISGLRPISLFDTSSFSVHQAGEINNFDPAHYLGKKGLRSLDRSTLLLNTAAKLAIDDASLTIDNTNSDSIGVSIGATYGSLHSISQFDREGLTEGPRYVNPSHFPNTVINSPASQVSIRFNIRGFNSTISTGMCASLDAIIYAIDFIKLERADIVLAGGVEELCEETFLGFYKTGHLCNSNGSEPINCPFDKRRDGFFLSEGSAVLVLESLESALARGATIYAEILGTANCYDPSSYKRYNPEGSGLSRAISGALSQASLTPADVDFICANANSSRDGDRMESHSLLSVFREDIQSASVSAVKSMLGETYSASGSLAAAAAAGSLNYSFVPPTLNYEVKDPECNLPNVNRVSVEREIATALVTSYDFHGNSSAVVIRKYSHE